MKKLMIIGSNSIHVYNYINLVKDYFDEIILITNKKREGTDVKTIELDFHLKLSSRLKTVAKIKSLIQEYAPSIIHIHQVNSYAYYSLLAARKSSVPKILTAWGSDILLSPKNSFLLKKMVQFNLRHADFFTSDSEFMAEEMRSLLPRRKLDILIANFGIEIIEKDLLKENIIYSNRLHKKLYQIESVINAFKLFLENSIDKSWKLVIAATGEETDNLKSMVEHLNLKGNVEFVGWVDQEKNVEYYSKARLFVSIPESDATSISLLEAMAYGCIPVLSDLPANREWIDDGKNGIIVNSPSENIFERALKLNMSEVASLNKRIIIEKGTKVANKKKFIQLYDHFLQQK
jgi:glycosyltransferase involved in cell wall biosynthesis